MLYITYVKKECLSLLLAALALNVPAATNAPSESEKKALDLLRETIYQYERRRGAVIPPPTASTNAASRKTTNGVANVPSSRTIPWSGTPPAGNVQPPTRTPPTTTSPAPATALPTVTAPPVATSPPPAATAHATSLAELERLYLDGKITAKQFQKYLQQHEQEQAAAVKSPETTAAVRPGIPATPTPPPKTAPPRTTAPPPKRAAQPPPEAVPSPDQAAITEVEKKMDELIQAKAARDQKATNISNAATNTVAGPPKTQRQKLDDLLRMYIEGKVTEAEYKERREQILATPK